MGVKVPFTGTHSVGPTGYEVCRSSTENYLPLLPPGDTVLRVYISVLRIRESSAFPGEAHNGRREEVLLLALETDSVRARFVGCASHNLSMGYHSEMFGNQVISQTPGQKVGFSTPQVTSQFFIQRLEAPCRLSPSWRWWPRGEVPEPLGQPAVRERGNRIVFYCPAPLTPQKCPVCCGQGLPGLGEDPVAPQGQPWQ